MRTEQGAVCAWMVLVMPLILASMGLVYDVAWVTVARGNLQAAADCAALAGVQELDLEALARGDCVIVEHKAIAAASEYARANLEKSLAASAGERCSVSIRVYQYGDPGQHGERLKPGSPSVCVRIELPTRLPITGLARVIAVHADASVIGRS